MIPVACPHCAAPNDAGVAYCGTCGKALPSSFSTAPRVIGGGEMATTAAGVKLQSEELHTQAKRAANALLLVAIIQTVFSGIIYLISANASRGRPGNATMMVVGTVFAIAIIFWALYFWARVNPLPAAIVGLVIYVSLWALDIIVALAAMANAPPGRPATGSGLFNGIAIKIIVVAMLIRAIKAGALHRKLMRQNQPLPAISL